MCRDLKIETWAQACLSGKVPQRAWPVRLAYLAYNPSALGQELSRGSIVEHREPTPRFVLLVYGFYSDTATKRKRLFINGGYDGSSRHLPVMGRNQGASDPDIGDHRLLQPLMEGQAVAGGFALVREFDPIAERAENLYI